MLYHEGLPSLYRTTRRGRRLASPRRSPGRQSGAGTRRGRTARPEVQRQSSSVAAARPAITTLT
jgi:hypothetical protein